MNRVFFLSLMLCTVLLNAQATNPAGVDDSTIARIGDRKISVKEFIDGYEFGPAFYKRVPDSKQVYLKYLINEALLGLDGKARKLDTTGLYNSTFTTINNDIITEQLFQKEIAGRLRIPEERIVTGIEQKNYEVSLRWLFCETESQAKLLAGQLQKGIPFDTLFMRSIADTIFPDERSLKISKFALYKKNPILAAVVDKLGAGMMSNPVQGDDGWYIVKVDEIERNILVTESEYNKYRQEVRNYYKKMQLDSLSDYYVDSLVSRQKPVINGDMFRILRAYIGRYTVKPELFKQWDLAGPADKAMQKLQISANTVNTVPLIKGIECEVTFQDYLQWFESREPYLSFSQKNKQAFSRSLEVSIWRMLRDKLLIAEAHKKQIDKDPVVQQTAEVWKNKILYALVREELLQKSTIAGIKELPVSSIAKRSQHTSDEINAELLRYLKNLEKKYPVSVNTALLQTIEVSEENNPKAVEVFAAKRTGVFPRPAFPVIDQFWKTWE